MGMFSGGGDNQIEINVTLEGEQATTQAAKLGDEIEKLGETAKETSGGFSELEKKIISTNQAAELGEKVGKALVSALKSLPNLLIDLANAGDKLGDLSESFEALGGSSLAIEKASDRINGILPNIDLLALANKAMVAGIPEVNKNFGDLAEYGRKMGDALGIDAKQAIEQLTQALVSGRPIALKQLGIMIDSDKAAKDYAQAMGIVGRELSETEKKAAITAQGLDQIRDKLGKMPATSDSVVDGLDAIKSQFTNLIGETGKAINENQDLTIELRKLANTLDDVDAKELAADLAELTSGFVKLATNGLSVAIDGLESFTNWLRVVKNLGGETSPVLDHLKTGLERTGQLAKKVFGGAYDEATDLLGAVVGWDKAQAKANKQLEDQAKGLDKVVDKEEELQLLLKDQQQLHEEELKRLKKEADDRDKATKAIEANKKAREENEKAQEQAADTADKALKGLQKELRELNEDLKLEGLTKSLETAFKTEDFGTAGKLKDEIKEQVKQGLIQGYKEAGGVLNAESEGIIEQQATIEANKIYTSTKEGVDKGLKDGFLESEFPNYLSEMITGSLLDGFKNGFTPETLQGAGDSLSAVFAQSFQESFQKIFSSKEGGGFAANWQDSLTNLGLSYGISSLTQNATDSKKDTQGGIISGAITGAAYGSSFGPWGTLIGGVVGAGAGYVVGNSGPSTNSDTKQRHETINFIEGLIDNKHLSFLQEQGNIIEGMSQRFNYAGTGGGLWDDIVRGSAEHFMNFTSGGVDQFVGAGEMTGDAIQGGQRYDPVQGQIAGPDWADQYWERFGQVAGESFGGLGAAFSEMAGQMGPQMEQVGVIIAENLGGNLDNARMLLQTLGIGAEDLAQSFMNIGLAGEESWHTIEVWMQRIPELTGEGLVGIGDLDGAMGQFISSAGRGQESLISLRNIAIEGIESGATSLADLRTKLEASGKYTVEQLDAFFGALDRRGITTLDGLRDSSDRLLGGVTADAQSLGFAWEENVSAGMEDSIEDVKELKKVINELPDEVEKNIVLKVRTEYSGDDAKTLYSDLKSGVGVARP